MMGGARDLLVIADDLTGALDTAGNFATPDNPVRIWLEPPLPETGRNALDTDSRDLDEEDAVQRVSATFRSRIGGPGGLVFKKIDSVMRGHPVAEAVAAFQAGRFRRALLAPAFPAMGRITKGGRQYTGLPAEMKAVGPAFVDALRIRGVAARMIDDDRRPNDGFVVADASTEADLLTAVERFGEGRNDLYIGAAGLASALAGPAVYLAPPRIELAICGTSHPVTLGQIKAVSNVEVVPMERYIVTFPDDPFALVPPPAQMADEEAKKIVVQTLDHLVHSRDKPKAAFVTGGWTLRNLCKLTNARHLVCLGLFEPGVAICTIVGGGWDGVTLLSKSGGFGGSQLLAELFEKHKSRH
jgi:uncharacterized protein YgbK (DUF1537 family)